MKWFFIVLFFVAPDGYTTKLPLPAVEFGTEWHCMKEGARISRMIELTLPLDAYTVLWECQSRMMK